jgi:hypothetical protein
MQGTTAHQPDPGDQYLQEVRERLADAMGIPVEAITPTHTSNPHLVAAAHGASMQAAIDGVIPAAAIVCGTCGRERGISDDYVYNPLQLVTGRPLGWYSNDDGEFCGECLAAMMGGQTP